MLCKILTICSILSLNLAKISTGIELVFKDIYLSDAYTMSKPAIEGDGWLAFSYENKRRSPIRVVTMGTSDHDRFEKQYNQIRAALLSVSEKMQESVKSFNESSFKGLKDGYAKFENQFLSDDNLPYSYEETGQDVAKPKNDFKEYFNKLFKVPDADINFDDPNDILNSVSCDRTQFGYTPGETAGNNNMANKSQAEINNELLILIRCNVRNVANIISNKHEYNDERVEKIRQFFNNPQNEAKKLEFISYVKESSFMQVSFDIPSGPVPVKNPFVIKVPFVDNQKEPDEIEIIPISEVSVQFRPIYKIMLSSVPSLFKYLSSKIPKQGSSELNTAAPSNSIGLLYELSECIIDGKCNLKDGMYNKFALKVLNYKRAKIDEIFKQYSSKDESLEVKGLFHMILAHIIRLFMIIHHPNPAPEVKSFIQNYQIKETSEIRNLLKYTIHRDLALITSRNSYSRIHAEMNTDQKELFKKVTDFFCEIDDPQNKGIEHCDVIYLLNDTADVWRVPRGKEERVSIRKWIESIKNPSDLNKRVKLSFKDKVDDKKKQIVETVPTNSDFLSPPAFVVSDEILIPPANIPDALNNELRNIYSMGDYDDVEKGYIVLEFSAYSTVDFKATHLFQHLYNMISNLEEELKKIESGETIRSPGNTVIVQDKQFL